MQRKQATKGSEAGFHLESKEAMWDPTRHGVGEDAVAAWIELTLTPSCRESGSGVLPHKLNDLRRLACGQLHRDTSTFRLLSTSVSTFRLTSLRVTCVVADIDKHRAVRVKTPVRAKEPTS